MVNESLRSFWRIGRFCCLIVFLFVFFLPIIHALEVPKRADGYVTDRAGLLSPAAKAELETTLRAFEEKTSNQVVVATFPSLEGDSLEDFSMRLAMAWKAGQKGKNNGVILLIFKNDRKMRIEVGYGLEGVLTDALAGEIIRNEIAPQFKQGRYDEGITDGVYAIMSATRNEYKASVPGAKINGTYIFLLGFLIALMAFLRFYVAFLEADIGSGGGGGFRSGGGGFSGGGGGFGGGGASGRW
ncbi:MAG: TPM domain-containing protein [Candidatus Omnitrophica bacterium]|nr:TPM domain-containing protein [Candidatus Omnitrophota bacterium]